MNEKINCTEAICAAHNFAVIGHPIAHTMSPFIHTKLFALGNGYPAADYGVIDLPPESSRPPCPAFGSFPGLTSPFPINRRSFLIWTIWMQKRLFSLRQYSQE